MCEETLQKNIIQLCLGVDACLGKKLITPALVLLYSGIDTVGWLNSTEPFATKSTFISWVDEYLLKGTSISCTSLELYAARCGLLHTFSPDSKLSHEGKVRRICYAWGTGNVQNCQRAIDLTSESEYVAIHINELYEAWQLGVLKFIEQLENDPNRKAIVYQKANKFFSNLSTKVVDEALAIFDPPPSKELNL